MCTYTALNSHCILITTHWKQSTQADPSHVHELKDGSCDYSHINSKSNTYLESRILLTCCHTCGMWMGKQNLHQCKALDEFVRFVTATPQAMTTCEIEEASSEDREFVELRQYIKDGNWKGGQHKQYIPICGELCVTGKLILHGTRIVILSELRPRVLSVAHEGHPGIVSMKQSL